MLLAQGQGNGPIEQTTDYRNSPVHIWKLERHLCNSVGKGQYSVDGAVTEEYLFGKKKKMKLDCTFVLARVLQRDRDNRRERQRFIIRNWRTQLQRLRIPKIWSHQAGDPGDPICTSSLNPGAWEPGELMDSFSLRTCTLTTPGEPMFRAKSEGWEKNDVPT